ncbi:MAG: signal peptidase II [Polyangiaceae bacterium]|jgi:signal peptidase II|nr:signal peptidase II [Polyangiaceae bacterium]MBK8941773.1 signal peptidase II [Polyangiaceae bacterium]
MSDESDKEKQRESGEDAAGPSDEGEGRDSAGSPSDDVDKTEAAEERKRRTRRPREEAAVRVVSDPEDDAPKPRPNYLFLAVTSAIFLALDLSTKEWALKRLKPLDKLPPSEDHISVLEGYFHFTYAENKGGAWGLLGDQQDYVRLPFFFLISALAVVFIVSLYRKLEPRQLALKWALPLVLGGALGNLFDRIRHQYVVDFIDWFYVGADGKEHHWPTFNVADIWIVAGVGLMVVDMFTPRRPVRRPAPKVKVALGDTEATKPTDREAEGA